MNDAIVPFTIAVEDSAIADLKQRLRQTRWPDQLPDSGWRYGADTAYIRQLCHYWAEQYDWRQHEAALNSWPQFTTEIDGQQLHFIHARSRHPKAVPLLLSHGWPGSVAEFTKVIAPLTDPEAHGGHADHAFHVVCPSLPGYGFSATTQREQVDVLAMAEYFSQLMARLGYTKYIAQGGDWGAMISTALGVIDAEQLHGIHINMPYGYPTGEDPREGLTPRECDDLAAMERFNALETGYQKIQGSKPQTLGVGLNDSPAGLCAWITEKFHGWMDCDGNIESVISRDELLTNISIYWYSASICSSTRLYYEVTQHARLPFLQTPVAVPTAVARYPKELMRFPRKWCDNVYSDIVQWREFECGGHFAALEQPRLFVDDLREFVGVLAL